jgi:hypothetical protein
MEKIGVANLSVCHTPNVRVYRDVEMIGRTA